jgi:hypothetical protein
MSLAGPAAYGCLVSLEWEQVVVDARDGPEGLTYWGQEAAGHRAALAYRVRTAAPACSADRPSR